MTIITLPPEIESPLAEEARKRGLTPEQLAVDTLRERFGDAAANGPLSSDKPAQPGIMSKLKRVKINAPADFASNLDLYLSGEKRVGEDVY